jgi:hypothetical protein
VLHGRKVAVVMGLHTEQPVNLVAVYRELMSEYSEIRTWNGFRASRNSYSSHRRTSRAAGILAGVGDKDAAGG